MLLRRQLTFLVLLGAAFAWGYYGDHFTAAPTVEIPSEPKQIAKDVPAPPPAAPPVAPTIGAAVYPSGPPSRPPGAEAPARQLTPPTTSLATTLEAIQPGKAQDTQIEQRNAYFDRLSQQLKELNTAGNGAAAAPPAAGLAPENPYGAPAPLQIQADPIAPDVDEEPDNLDEEDAADDADLDAEEAGDEEAVAE